MLTLPSRPSGEPDQGLQVEAWIDQILDPLEIRRITTLETLHVRPWSWIARCTSSAGNLYFKSCEERSRHEPELVQMLAARHPDCSPVVLAADPQRGWLLMQDAGLRLREQLREDNWLDHWKRILTRYAELQIDLAPDTDKLLAVGVADRRPKQLADQLESILGDPDLVMPGSPDGLNEVESACLYDLLPEIRSRCAQLEQANIPDSLNHGDFHDANIFLLDEGYVFTDWGDASLSHPFFSLRTAFVSLENTLGLEENAPIFDSLRDTYLEAWRVFDGGKSLARTFDLARRLWSLGSLLSWQHSIRGLPARARRPYQGAIPSLLRELLEANAD